MPAFCSWCDAGYSSDVVTWDTVVAAVCEYRQTDKLPSTARANTWTQVWSRKSQQDLPVLRTTSPPPPLFFFISPSNVNPHSWGRGKLFTLSFGSVGVDSLLVWILEPCSHELVVLWKVTVWSECLGLVLRSERVKYSLAMLPSGTCDGDKDFPFLLWRMIPPAPSFAC